MYLRVHSSPKGEVIAVCDAELIGRKLAAGKLVLDLEEHAGFYKGKKVGSSQAVLALRGAQNINIVGKKSLSAAKGAGLDVAGAISISGVPHLQVYRI